MQPLTTAELAQVTGGVMSFTSLLEKWAETIPRILATEDVIALLQAEEALGGSLR
ncbi:bacteriocin [Chitinimonas sp. BJB300]|uniref:bacteriocin n=1 Tax=Chitinimonas sp. BJB300 TaxID=1559339 RepID=UPI00117E1FEF|nr:bacteriocin [Chitinimonas sp. BJB300]